MNFGVSCMVCPRVSPRQDVAGLFSGACRLRFRQKRRPACPPSPLCAKLPPMLKAHKFETGYAMPLIGLGTWKSKPGEVHAAVREAIRVGYRHIDCAAAYGNEAEIGAALGEAMQSGEVKREELWITSKLWNDAHGRDNVAPALEK